MGHCGMVFVGDFDMERIEAEIEDFLFRRGLELVDLRFEHNPTRPFLEIFADKMGGITVKDLSEINGRLTLFLEAGDFFPDAFNLVVSSPGLDRVIKKEADFKRFTGRRIRLKPINTSGKEAKSWEATLIGFENGEVIIETNDKKTERYALSELKKVRLVPDIDFSIDSAKGTKKRRDK